MFTNGARVAPLVIQAPYEIVVATDKVELPPQVVKIEYDNDGLHFLTNWGMVSINKEEQLDAQSDAILC